MSEPKSIAQLMLERGWSLTPTTDDPGPKWVVCRVCQTEFKTKAHWYFYRWMYANTCAACDDRMLGIERDRPDAPVKTFRCVSCKKLLTQKGLWKKGAWFYEMTCPACGTEQSCYSAPLPLEGPAMNKKKRKTPYKDDDE
jgi:phage FluMu protein Com